LIACSRDESTGSAANAVTEAKTIANNIGMLPCLRFAEFAIAKFSLHMCFSSRSCWYLDRDGGERRRPYYYAAAMFFITGR
jgi:hypothetical protein